MRGTPLRNTVIATGCLLAAGACAPAPPPAAAPPAGGEPPPPAAAAARAPLSPADARREAFIDSLLVTMTLEEKAGQLTQFPGGFSQTGPTAPAGGEEQIRNGQVGSFLGIWGADLTRRLQRIAVEESRTHIPLVFALDIIHGYRTVFPVPLGEASSFDPALAEQTARVAAVEGTANGIAWTFAPMVDIARDPRWGRIVEGSGEDPYLGSVLAAARVHGFQGARLDDSTTLAATAKHFVAYGGAEAGRDYNTVDVSERTLREVYLPPFHAAVCAGVATIMPSFNEISGIPAHANRALLTGVLRDEWGFDGTVVSDYTGVMELIPHGIAADSAEAARLALQAGVDIDMVSGIYLKFLPDLVRQGKVPQAELDEAVRHVLRLKYRLGLFEDPYRYSDAARERTQILTPEARALARRAAQESMVLLKDSAGVLPLDRDRIRTLAVIGPLADDARSALGNWVIVGKPEDAVTPLAGLRRAVAAGTRVLYAKGADATGSDTTGFAEAVRIARQADAVVLVIGETQDMSAEASSRATVDLPGVQLRLAQEVLAAGKPTAVVLMNGRPLALPWLAEHAPAILEAWYPGVETGTALADLLFGDVSPSGKLPVTFPRVTGQVPIYYNHKSTGRPPREEEKYTSKYLDVPWTPLWPFGHGLSYTTFSYSAPRLSPTTMAARDSLQVSVDVTNTGQRAGTEVVQLYLRDEVGSVTRPVAELRGFRRVELRPGETRTVTFTVGPDDLAFYGLEMRRIVEPGWFTVSVGGSSADVKQARFQVTGDGAVEVPEECGDSFEF